MDFIRQLDALNADPRVLAVRAGRKALEQTLWARIPEAMGHEAPAAVRQASGWNLPYVPNPNGDSGSTAALGEPIGPQHPGIAAVQVVRQAFLDLHTQLPVDLRYTGMRRTSGHGSAAMDEGWVMVEAELSSVSGARHTLDIPVIVHAGRMLAPSVCIHSGATRVLTQHTIDDIIGRGEFTAGIPDREHMFALPPPDAARHGISSLAGERMPLVRPGMFSPPQPSARPRMASASATPPRVPPRDWQADVRAAVRGHRAPVVGRKERVAFYSPQVNEGPRGPTGADVMGADGSHLDVAERPLVGPEALPGASVRTRRDVWVLNRGGTRFTIPKGTDGTVLRDIDGAGRAVYVRFPELGYAAVVAVDALRAAGRRGGGGQ